MIENVAGDRGWERNDADDQRETTSAIENEAEKHCSDLIFTFLTLMAWLWFLERMKGILGKKRSEGLEKFFEMLMD